MALFQDGCAVQEYLRSGEPIGVPYMQQKFHITYREAKAFLDNLVSREWISPPEEGLLYTVHDDRLVLRRLVAEDVERMISAFDGDCLSALECIHRFPGSSFGTIEDSVHGEDDTTEALQQLTAMHLIYCVKESYYLCISEKQYTLIVTNMRYKLRSMRSSNADVKLITDTVRKSLQPLLKKSSE